MSGRTSVVHAFSRAHLRKILLVLQLLYLQTVEVTDCGDCWQMMAKDRVRGLEDNSIVTLLGNS
jgi:hypothetical protein